MTEPDWNFADARFLSYVLAGTEPGAPPLHVVLNAAAESIDVKLPAVPPWGAWTLLLDTVSMTDGTVVSAGASFSVPARAVLVFSAAS